MSLFFLVGSLIILGLAMIGNLLKVVSEAATPWFRRKSGTLAGAWVSLLINVFVVVGVIYLFNNGSGS